MGVLAFPLPQAGIVFLMINLFHFPLQCLVVHIHLIILIGGRVSLIFAVHMGTILTYMPAVFR